MNTNNYSEKIQGGIDPERLENVKRHDDGSIRAACPACRAAGSDKSGNHLRIEPGGKFGCATHKDDGEHRKEIFRLAGNRIAVTRDRRTFRHKRNGSGSTRRTAENFDWQKCVAAISCEADAQKLAARRGLSVEFVRWIHTQGIVGIFERQNCVRKSRRRRQGCFVLTSGWQTANGFLIRKDSKPRRSFLATQNPPPTFSHLNRQWDAFAVMDKLGWHTANGLGWTSPFLSHAARATAN
jgi:hypothetical protein